FGLCTERSSNLGYHVSFQYGPSTFLTRAKLGESAEFSFERDRLGREVRRTLPGGMEQRQQFSVNGQLVEQLVGRMDSRPKPSPLATPGDTLQPPSVNRVVHRKYQYDARG